MGAKGKKSPSEPGGETRGLHSVTVGRSVTVHRQRSILLGSWCCSNDNTRQVGIHVSVVIENEEKNIHVYYLCVSSVLVIFFLHFFNIFVFMCTTAGSSVLKLRLQAEENKKYDHYAHA